MSSTVQQLINRGQKLVTVLRDDPVQKALELMIEHEYSQLPVVDREGKIVEEKGKAYMVTNDSILRTINSFKIPLNDLHLRVADAMVKTSTFHEDNDLFDLLNDLQDTYAVCILDREQKVIGVVTSYDAMAYFRQRAEDMMLVEDIEEALKKYILAAFPSHNGEANEALTKAIEEIMPSNRELQGRFQRALTEYLAKAGMQTQVLQKSIAQQMFEQYVYRKEPTKTFDRLSLNQYIDLFSTRVDGRTTARSFRLSANTYVRCLKMFAIFVIALLISVTRSPNNNTRRYSNVKNGWSSTKSQSSKNLSQNSLLRASGYPNLIWNTAPQRHPIMKLPLSRKPSMPMRVVMLP
ncbi:HPP family protein [Ktedonobacter sp. SOSP1-85]|uniref:CBS domain-containing protein n=1 Tax=Ktedonobacter sp. SOSP1-85 TaxID=2778367 RepID=UPI0019153AA2|nr:CBS domain-containing protein [Ktedonobacter sp. SOSP1-85]